MQIFFIIADYMLRRHIFPSIFDVSDEFQNRQRIELKFCKN